MFMCTQNQFVIWFLLHRYLLQIFHHENKIVSFVPWLKLLHWSIFLWCIRGIRTWAQSNAWQAASSQDVRIIRTLSDRVSKPVFLLRTNDVRWQEESAGQTVTDTTTNIQFTQWPVLPTKDGCQGIIWTSSGARQLQEDVPATSGSWWSPTPCAVLRQRRQTGCLPGDSAVQWSEWQSVEDSTQRWDVCQEWSTPMSTKEERRDEEIA